MRTVQKRLSLVALEDNIVPRVSQTQFKNILAWGINLPHFWGVAEVVRTRTQQYQFSSPIWPLNYRHLNETRQNTQKLCIARPLRNLFLNIAHIP